MPSSLPPPLVPGFVLLTLEAPAIASNFIPSTPNNSALLPITVTLLAVALLFSST